jgi:hypothetical protein
MRAVGRIVAFLLIDDNLKRELEIEFGQSEHAFYQDLALGKR